MSPHRGNCSLQSSAQEGHQSGIVRIQSIPSHQLRINRIEGIISINDTGSCRTCRTAGIAFKSQMTRTYETPQLPPAPSHPPRVTRLAALLVIAPEYSPRPQQQRQQKLRIYGSRHETTSRMTTTAETRGSEKHCLGNPCRHWHEFREPARSSASVATVSRQQMLLAVVVASRPYPASRTTTRLVTMTSNRTLARQRGRRRGLGRAGHK